MKTFRSAALLLLCLCMFTGCNNGNITAASQSPQATTKGSETANPITTQTPSASLADNRVGTIIMNNANGKSVSFSLNMPKTEVEQLLKKGSIAYLDGEKDLTVTDVAMLFTKYLYFQFGENLQIIYVNSKNIETALGLKNGDKKEKIEELYGKTNNVSPCSYYSDDITKNYTHYEYKRNGYYFWVLVDNETQTVKTWGVSAFAFPGNEHNSFELWGNVYSNMFK